MSPSNIAIEPALWLFWLAAAQIVYTYAGYPVLVWLLSKFRPRPVATRSIEPFISLILAVHNEASTIRRKLENVSLLDYPQDKMEILVVSDHSTDATHKIVREYPDARIKLLEVPERRGKHYAQKVGIDAARGEILVFTDTAPLLAPQSLRNMVQNFADDEVGCVSGEDCVVSPDGQIQTEGAYIDYDMAVRRWESRVGSCVGLSGAFFGVRRELCEPWWHDRSSDFYLGLQAVRRGLRAISDPGSVHYYASTTRKSDEFRRKVRTVINGMVVFGDSLDLLNVWRFGMFSIQFVSHKLSRWVVPISLLMVYITSGGLAPSYSFFALVFGLQSAFYLMAALGGLSKRLERLPLFRIPTYFVLSNLAILRAAIEFRSGRKRAIWQPTRRP